MKVINSSNSKMLVEYILKSKGILEVNKNLDKKLDFIATDNNTMDKYGIIVRYRNIPCSETRSSVLKEDDLDKLKEVCGTDLTPTIAFLIFDEEKRTTYIFIFTVERLEDLSKEGNVETFKQVMHGLQIKYGIGHNTTDELLHSLKMKIDCTELKYSEKNFFDESL